MFDLGFAHYLTFAAADQRTMHDLRGIFTGLIVPGTVAAFQRTGTGGFVLSLSATQAGTPYVIDSRFPLFQQPLIQKKKSHYELAANVLGAPELISDKQPKPSKFTDKLIEKISRNWASFNSEYVDATSEKFDKYAKRLNEKVDHARATGPKYILPPYTVVKGRSDPWWGVSSELYEQTVKHSGETSRCVRVVAVNEASSLSDVLKASDSKAVAIWVSGLDELNTVPSMLSEYGSAIREAHESGKQLFALYGGFFSVLLSCVGLGGSCHGIGFGEHREYLELPRSGPPPARYYIPKLHR